MSVNINQSTRSPTSEENNLQIDVHISYFTMRAIYQA
jgi:hypothetical protein